MYLCKIYVVFTGDSKDVRKQYTFEFQLKFSSQSSHIVIVLLCVLLLHKLRLRDVKRLMLQAFVSPAYHELLHCLNLN